MEQEKKGVWDVISDLLLELDSATAAMDLIADGMEYNDDDGNADAIRLINGHIKDVAEKLSGLSLRVQKLEKENKED